MANFLKEYGQPLVYKLIQPLIDFLVKTKVTPNAITVIGFLLNILATCIFIYGAEYKRSDFHPIFWGSITILFAGLFDMIDGRLARVSKQESVYGALFDSVIDRYSELIMFLGICYYLVAQHYFFSSVFAFIAMIGSLMVSYVRARAESLGIECSSGWMQRPERILIISLSGILCGIIEMSLGTFKYTFNNYNFPIFENITIFTFPIFVLAILTNITALQRLLDSKISLEKSSQK